MIETLSPPGGDFLEKSAYLYLPKMPHFPYVSENKIVQLNYLANVCLWPLSDIR